MNFSNTTQLDNLLSMNDESQIESVYDINSILNKIGNNQHDELFVDIRQYCMEYSTSATYYLETFLIDLVKNTQLSMYLKIEIAKCIYQETQSDELLMYLVRDPKFKTTIVNQQLDILKLLEDTKFVIDYIVNLLSDKTILDSLKLLKSISSKGFTFEVIFNLYLSFINNKNYYGTHEQIMACEYILLHNETPLENKNNIMDILVSIGKNVNIQENIRANAIDLLLEFDETVEIANTLLNSLSENSFNIYHNRQNIHNAKIKKSAYTILENLKKIQAKAEEQYSFDFVKTEILNMSSCESVVNALNSIQLRDKDVLTNFNLSNILVSLWYYIQTQENPDIKDLFTQRLVEELTEMSDTCHSGHSIRLCNVVSGIEFSIQISWEDQIRSNLQGRLMARLKKQDNYGDILSSMTENKQESKTLFNKYFIRYIPEIKNELFFEFVNGKYINAYDFEIYFKNAILHLQQ